MKFGKILSLGLALLGAAAQADDCDYVGRHYKADIVPLQIKVANVPGHGDIGGWQSLQVLVANYGSQEIPGVTGLFPAKRLRVSFMLNKKIGSFPVMKTLDGSLNVPMGPGKQQWVGYTLPTNFIPNCSTMTLTIDYGHTVGQHGCEVFSNDSKVFRVRVPGAGLCLSDAVKPHP